LDTRFAMPDGEATARSGLLDDDPESGRERWGGRKHIGRWHADAL
jgi:hypothetical protein